MLPGADLSSAAQLLGRLKTTARSALLGLETHGEVVIAEIARTDSHHLSQQNLSYERAHVLREIAKCNDYETPETNKLRLMPVEQAVRAGFSPPEGIREGAGGTGVPSHAVDPTFTLMMARMQHEMSMRKQLESDLEVAKSKFASVRSTISTLTKLEESLPGRLKGMESSVAPLRSIAGDSFTVPAIAAAVHARMLPGPLLSLYNLFTAVGSLENLTRPVADESNTDAAVAMQPVAVTVVPSMPSNTSDMSPEDSKFLYPVSSSRARHFASVLGVLPAASPSGATLTGDAALSGQKRTRGQAFASDLISAVECERPVLFTAGDVWAPFPQAIVVIILIPTLHSHGMMMMSASTGGVAAGGSLPHKCIAIRFQYVPLLDVVTVAADSQLSDEAIAALLFKPHTTPAGVPLAAPTPAPRRIEKVVLQQWMLHNLLGKGQVASSSSSSSTPAPSSPSADLGLTVHNWVAAVEGRVASGTDATVSATANLPATVPRWVMGRAYAWAQCLSKTAGLSDLTADPSVETGGVGRSASTLVMRMRVRASGAMALLLQAQALVRLPVPTTPASALFHASGSLEAASPHLTLCAALLRHTAEATPSRASQLSVCAAACTLAHSALTASPPSPTPLLAFEDITSQCDFAAVVAADSSKCAVHSYIPKTAFDAVVLRVFRAVFGVEVADSKQGKVRLTVQALAVVPVEYPEQCARFAVHAIACSAGSRSAVVPKCPLNVAAATLLQDSALQTWVTALGCAAAHADECSSSPVDRTVLMLKALSTSVSSSGLLLCPAPQHLPDSLTKQLHFIALLLSFLPQAALVGDGGAMSALFAGMPPPTEALPASWYEPIPPLHHAGASGWAHNASLVSVARGAATVSGLAFEMVWR